ncbi:hypothetical protein JW977_03900 [Candidatus Falkowbacteria bacterium]|nr:hypothetical protein [Candidatus Falkowbacteria bacterium]
MTDERWQEIKDMVKKNFGIIENQVLDLPEEEGKGTKEELIFAGPMGRIKLEYIVKPLVLDKKTTYSKRIGSETKVQYITSDTEKVRRMEAFKWNESADNWEKIIGEALSF